MTKHQQRLKEERRKKRLEAVDRFKAAEIAVDALLVIPAYILHDTFGFGNKRIEKFINEFKRLWTLVKEGKVKLETLIESLDAETGILYKSDTCEIYNRRAKDES